MELRDILKPYADRERIEFLKARIQDIESELEKSSNVEKLVEEFNQITGKSYDVSYIKNYWKGESLEDFARAAAQPNPTKIADITKQELIEIVRKIIEADEHTDFYLELLKNNVPHPNVSDLIFWPSEFGLDDNLSPEEIVNIALSYENK